MRITCASLGSLRLFSRPVVFAGHQIRFQAAQQAASFFDRRFATPIAIASRPNYDFNPRFRVRAGRKPL